MAGKYETKLNADRKKLKDAIKSLEDKRDKTNDAKLKNRLRSQIKSKTRSLKDLNQRPAGMRTGIDSKGGKNKRIPTQPGKQAHHFGSSLNNAAAFFEDLDPPEKLLMEHAFAKYGIVPGDVTMNRLDMYDYLHQAGIHKLERDLKLEGKQYFKPGASFQEKLNAVKAFAEDQRYLRQIAEEAQFKADNELGGLSRRVEATATSELADEYHSVEKRRLAETTRDFREYAPEVHAAAGTQTKPDISGRPTLDSSGGGIKLSNKFKGLTKVAKGVARFIPGSLDDVALGTGFGGIAAGAAFVTGGDPAQAFGDVVSDVATSELQVGELFDESEDFGKVLEQSREQNARPLMDRLDEGALGDAGRAIKRGGRLSFEFGGVKLTLPEYGYSELLGFN